ncbi:MAG: hypothetical protein KF764_09775 [Labilithrix sp.]|nr:hypothetical protein [Labilithrix sp.]
MRSLLALAACSILAVFPACTEKRIIVKNDAPPAEVPAEEEEEPIDTPATDPLVIDLGEVTAGKDVSFEIPEGALGFNITAEGKVADFDQNRPFGIQRITDPKGTVVHDNFTPNGGTKETSIATFDVIASASVPQGDNAPKDLAGTWKVRFGVYGASSKPKLKGKIRVQSSGDGAFHGGALDLHVHVPSGLRIGNRTVNAAKAESDSDISDRVDTFFALTTNLLGIERGEVVFHEESSSYRELDGVSALLRGFAISSGQKDGTPALHVLLTNLIAEGGQPFAAGISPGIPGAATIFGRNVSGIIVTTSHSVDQDVLTMLHEAGHFFGLNHTTEFDGQSSDPLSDTPVCESIASGNIDSCPDRKNIMFAAGARDGPVTLSPTQKRVYRGSPIYRAFTAGGGSTMSFKPRAPVRSLAPSFKRTFRVSGSDVLSPVERELSFGFCGLNGLDANGLVKRYGRDQAIAQLTAASADTDLAPYIRGRANLALRALGAP